MYCINQELALLTKILLDLATEFLKCDKSYVRAKTETKENLVWEKLFLYE